MNKRTIVVFSITSLLVPSFAVAGGSKDNNKRRSPSADQQMGATTATPAAPAATYTQLVPVGQQPAQTYAQAAKNAPAQQQQQPSGAKKTGLSSSAPAITIASQLGSPSSSTAALSSSSSSQSLSSSTAATASTGASADQTLMSASAPATAATTGATDNASSSASTATTAAATEQQPATETTTVAATPAPITDVRFALDRAQFTAAKEFVPEQSMIGVGYDAVISDVAKYSVTAETKTIDYHRDRVGKALRDLYYYLDGEMRARRYNKAQEYLAKIQLLATTAQQKGILADDKKANVVAWVNSYAAAIDALEKDRAVEINALRKYDAQTFFNWQQLAITLGLQDDAQKAISDFEKLDSSAAQEKKSTFVQTANDLLTFLTSQNDVEGIRRTIDATVSKSIIPGSDQLTATYLALEEQKKNLKKEARKLVHQALEKAAKLSALQNQIRDIETEHYSTTTVDALGKKDTINYVDLGVTDLLAILNQKDDGHEKSE